MGNVKMWPATGESLLKYCGDWIQFRFAFDDGRPIPPGWTVFLRTNLGRARRLEEEIIHAHSQKWPLIGGSWRDLPMPVSGSEASIEIPIHEVGYFEAKAYARDEEGRQIWPEGPNVGISTHPDFCRTGNIIYCSFVRLFGESIAERKALPEKTAPALDTLDSAGFSCIPPSGKFRDLVKYLPHIVGNLGCKIIHLLPVNPTPTTFARMGRFGSPYAALDLTGIDPALVEFEHQTSPADQFCELSDAIHRHGARLIIDMAVNHTGWGSWLHSTHPEWYVRDEQGNFVSPGAWGVTWGDLSELNTHLPDLWDYLADVFLTWCHRGVDGFRCDAGYKIPMEAWRYIISRVRQEFSDTIFLLEGLGGSWEATETLLTQGRMQFAYSELFQNYSSKDISWYLDYSLKQSSRKGVWVHYSETHDNSRLAAQGKQWSLFRNQLCALTSVSGGFAFTCGVEWLADEKINVHQRTGLSWNNPNNIVRELSRLNELLSEHPCFFDGAQLTRLSDGGSVYVLRRDCADRLNTLWIFANTDMEHPAQVRLFDNDLTPEMIDLLTRERVRVSRLDESGRQWIFEVPPGTCWCLSKQTDVLGLKGDAYRKKRAMASWALKASCRILHAQPRSATNWQSLSELAASNPVTYLGALSRLKDQKVDPKEWMEQIRREMQSPVYCPVVSWQLSDLRRTTLLPKDHWLYFRNTQWPFQVQLRSKDKHSQVLHSVETDKGHIAAFSPDEIRDVLAEDTGELSVVGTIWGEREYKATGKLLYVAEDFQNTSDFMQTILHAPGGKERWILQRGSQYSICDDKDALVLLTNGRGAMSRIRADLGAIRSKYDCLLGANLHPDFPVDRHVFVKRARIWVNADGFYSQLSAANLAALTPEPPAKWNFIVSAGDARIVHLQLTVDLIEERNTLVLKLERLSEVSIPQRWKNRILSPKAHVSVTVRLDIEDRSFHSETHLNDESRRHFEVNIHSLLDEPGFAFTPAADRSFRAYTTAGKYHPQPECCNQILHPFEATRGQLDRGDAFSPGWFELPLSENQPVYMVVDAEKEPISNEEMSWFEERRQVQSSDLLKKYTRPLTDIWERELLLGAKAFLVRRGADRGRTVIAGYPWFMDWGRDTLICARGYLAAGYWPEVLELLQVFGRMEKNGTLPNVIYGDNDSNRNTSDAPLWFGVVLEEAAALAENYRFTSEQVYQTPLENQEQTLLDVLKSIATHYIQGTPNGIFVDPDSGLVWSPAHYTWMDTNYPAGTPRCGYPIEIQALWIRLLRQLSRLAPAETEWEKWALKAEQSLQLYFWLPEKKWFADGLWAEDKKPAAQARVDDALRPNQFLPISFGLFDVEKSQRALRAALRHLVIPGAMRSLAPLPVSCLAPVFGPEGRLLNNPGHPYWPQYEGDEDTRRKPAYHNGTAWGYMLPVFCEALAKAWPQDETARKAALAYLKSAEYWTSRNCLGHIPEIMDGDAPHTPRGCDAQAWSICETLRVWKLLKKEDE